MNYVCASQRKIVTSFNEIDRSCDYGCAQEVGDSAAESARHADGDVISRVRNFFPPKSMYVSTDLYMRRYIDDEDLSIRLRTIFQVLRRRNDFKNALPKK